MQHTRKIKDEDQIVEEVIKKIIKANVQFKHSLEKSYDYGLYIMPNLGTELAPNSYYLVNPTGKLWELFYVPSDEEIRSIDIDDVFMLNNLLDDLSVSEILQKDPK